jgi:hypothetical protein
MKPGDTVYLTKYALTDGITERVFQKHAESGRYAFVGGEWRCLRPGFDLHATREAAITAAKSIRDKKVASLRKQIERLEAIDFA